MSGREYKIRQTNQSCLALASPGILRSLIAADNLLRILNSLYNEYTEHWDYPGESRSLILPETLFTVGWHHP